MMLILVLYNADKLLFICMRRNFFFVHFTTQIAKQLILSAVFITKNAVLLSV